MDSAEAHILLASKVIGDRLRAARYFQMHASPIDLDVLSEALRKERTVWIRTALRVAVDRLSHVSSSIGEMIHVDEDQDLLARDAYSRALEEVTGILLHELGAPISAIRLLAQREIPDFPSSRTSAAIDRLRRLLEAIRRLKKASSLPAYTDFDLVSLVSSVTEELATELPTESIRLAGPKPFLVLADYGSLYIAIKNGFKNAIEAVGIFSTKTPPEVTVNWGRAGDEYFLAIIDSGPGFRDDPELARRLGSTNKQGHFGFGLATAEQVMKSLRGTLLLANNADGGATFELRWKKNESTGH